MHQELPQGEVHYFRWWVTHKLPVQWAALLHSLSWGHTEERQQPERAAKGQVEGGTSGGKAESQITGSPPSPPP